MQDLRQFMGMFCIGGFAFSSLWARGLWRALIEVTEETNFCVENVDEVSTLFIDHLSQINKDSEEQQQQWQHINLK